MIKTSIILRNAKKELWDGKGHPNKSRFICYAIEEGNPTFRHNGKVAALYKEIAARLYPYGSVDGWLQHNPKLFPLTLPNVQKYRHAWVDALIAEYEAKGD